MGFHFGVEAIEELVEATIRASRGDEEANRFGQRRCEREGGNRIHDFEDCHRSREPADGRSSRSNGSRSVPREPRLARSLRRRRRRLGPARQRPFEVDGFRASWRQINERATQRPLSLFD